MHGAALPRTQGWTRTSRRTGGTRTLENGLPRHRTSRCWPHRRSRLRRRRRRWSNRRLVHGPRSGLRDNHPRQGCLRSRRRGRRPGGDRRCCLGCGRRSSLRCRRGRRHHRGRGVRRSCRHGRWGRGRGLSRRSRWHRDRGLDGWRRDHPRCCCGRMRRNFRSRRGDGRFRLDRRMRYIRTRRRNNYWGLLLADRTQHIAWPGNMGEVDLGLDCLGVDTAGTRGLRRSLRLTRRTAKMSPHFFCLMIFKRAGMRLLLGDADFKQHVENRFAFDFQFPGQVVDSSLAHPPLFFLRISR